MAGTGAPSPAGPQAASKAGVLGRLGGLFSFRGSSAKPPTAESSSKKYKVASLPEGNTFYYDPDTKQWREKGKESAASAAQPPSSPPKSFSASIPPSRNHSSMSLETDGSDSAAAQARSLSGPFGLSPTDSGTASPGGNIYSSKGSTKDLRNRYVDVAGASKNKSRTGSFGSLNELVTPGGASAAPSPKVSMFMPMAATSSASAAGGAQSATPAMFMPAPAAKRSLEYEAKGDTYDESQPPEGEQSSEANAAADTPLGDVSEASDNPTVPPPSLFMPQPVQEDCDPSTEVTGSAGPASAPPTGPSMFMPVVPDNCSTEGRAEDTVGEPRPALFVPPVAEGQEGAAGAKEEEVSVEHASPENPLGKLFPAVALGHSKSGSDFFAELPSPQPLSAGSSVVGDSEGPKPLAASNLGATGAAEAPAVEARQEMSQQQPQEAKPDSQQQVDDQQYAPAAEAPGGGREDGEQQTGQEEYAYVPYLDADGNWQYFYGHVNSEEYRYYYQLYCEYCAAYSQEGYQYPDGNEDGNWAQEQMHQAGQEGFSAPYDSSQMDVSAISDQQHSFEAPAASPFAPNVEAAGATETQLVVESATCMEATLMPDNFAELVADDREASDSINQFGDAEATATPLEAPAAEGEASQQPLDVAKVPSLEAWAVQGLSALETQEDTPRAAPIAEGSGPKLEPQHQNGTNGLSAEAEDRSEAHAVADQAPSARRERRQRKQREKKPKAKLAKALPWEEAAVEVPLGSSTMALVSLPGLEDDELLPLQQEAEADRGLTDFTTQPQMEAKPTTGEDNGEEDVAKPQKDLSVKGTEVPAPGAEELASADREAARLFREHFESQAVKLEADGPEEALPVCDQVGSSNLTVKGKVMEVQLMDETALAAADPERSFELTTNFESDAHLTDADAEGHDLPPAEVLHEDGMAVLGTELRVQAADESSLLAADPIATHGLKEHLEGAAQQLEGSEDAEGDARMGMASDKPGTEWAVMGQRIELQPEQQQQQPDISGFDRKESADLTAHFEAAAAEQTGPGDASEELPEPEGLLAVAGTQMDVKLAGQTDLVVFDPETTFRMTSELEAEAQSTEAVGDREEDVLPPAELCGSDISVLGTQISVHEADEVDLVAAGPEVRPGYVAHFEAEAQHAEDLEDADGPAAADLIGEDTLAVVGQQMDAQPGDSDSAPGRGWEDEEDLLLNEHALDSVSSTLPNGDTTAEEVTMDGTAAEYSFSVPEAESPGPQAALGKGNYQFQELQSEIEALHHTAEEKEGRLLSLVERPCKANLSVDSQTGLVSLDVALCSPTTRLAEETRLLREELDRRTEEVQRLLDLEGGQNALLQEQLAKRTGEVQMLVRMEEENVMLKEDLEQKVLDLEAATEDIDTLREAAKALHDDLEASRLHISRLEAELERISGSLQAAQVQALSASDTMACTERLVAALAELEAAERQASELQGSLTASTHEGLELRNHQIDDLAAEVEHLREQLRISEEAREAEVSKALSATAAAVQAHEAEMQALQTDLAVAQEAHRAAKAQFSELEARTQMFEQQCLAAQLEVDQLHAVEQQLKETMDEQRQQLEAMRTQLTEQTSRCAELGELVTSAAHRESCLAESAHALSEELMAAQSQLSEALGDRDRLTASLKEAQESAHTLQADLMAAQEREQRLTAEVASVSGELEGARAEASSAGREALEAAHKETEEVKSKMRAAIKKGKAIDKERKEIEERLRETAARAEAAEERCARAEGAVAATQEQYEGAFSSLQEELDVARAEAQGLRESLGQSLQEQTQAREAAETKLKAAVKKGKAIEKEKKALEAKMAEAPPQEQVAEAMAHLQEDLEHARAEAQSLKESLREALAAESDAQEALSKLGGVAVGILGAAEAAMMHTTELGAFNATSGDVGQEISAVATEALRMALQTKESAALVEAQLQDLASQPEPTPVADTQELEALKQQMAAVQARAEAAEARCSKLEQETQELKETTQVQEQEFNDLLACLGQETAKVEALQEVLEGQGMDVNEILGKVEAEYGFGEGEEELGGLDDDA